MKIYSKADIEIQATPEEVFDFATNVENLPKVFKGYGVIPSIIKAEIVGGIEMQQGVTRRVTNSDNSIIDEEIIILKKPTKQTYQLVKGFKPPFSFLVKKGGGDWTFSPIANTPKLTFLNWEFYFELTSPLAYPIMAFIMSAYFQKAQQLCLKEIKKNLENP
ncbi:MAG TPA: SRPBCC family protein [Halomicronema sp.]